jgi:hypothetical protein
MSHLLRLSSTRYGNIRLQLVCVTILTLAAASAGAQPITVQLPPPPPGVSTPAAAETQPAAAPAAAVNPAFAPAKPVKPSLTVPDVRKLARDTEANLRDVVLRGALDPAITGRNNAPVQAVALEVGKEGETVGKATLSWRLDDYNSAVDVILKGPIVQSSGIPITDRGLASGASVNLGYNLTLFASSVSAATIADMRTAVDASGESLSPLERLIATGIKVRDEDLRAYTEPTLKNLSKPNMRAAFESGDADAIAFQLFKDNEAKLNRTVSLRGSYGVGSTTFKFAELADPITEKNETKSDNAASVSVAYVQLLKNGDAEAPLMLISGGYTHSDRWRPGRTRQICTPLNVASATECRSLVVGAPTKLTEKSLEIDIRSWAYAQALGINPHFSYDRTTKKWTSEVNLSYLVLKEKVNGLPQLDTKALTVGVRVGKRPDEDGGVYAAVFFGTVLSK